MRDILDQGIQQTKVICSFLQREKIEREIFQISVIKSVSFLKSYRFTTKISLLRSPMASENALPPTATSGLPNTSTPYVFKSRDGI